MMDVDAQHMQAAAFGRMLAAYKLRLARKAEELHAQPETWGRGQPISRAEEQSRLEPGDSYRISPYPYPGLRSFDPEEGDLFFGRERNVDEVRGRLAAHRIVVVLGGSGSGKSSLVRAGLLPRLNKDRRIEGRDGRWHKAEFRPRTDPLGELADALADQVLCPLLGLQKPGLAEAMELPPGTDAEAARVPLRRAMRGRFIEAKAAGREAVLATLLDVVDRQLDLCDHFATQGRRVAEPNLLLLLDQLEEVFRPEVAESERKALLDLIVDIHAYMEDRGGGSGLFLAATMRSEEMHRCAEHRGLSEVAIGSGYQLELLDPNDEEDRRDLHRAIVEPARNVFADWGLGYDSSHPDAPFAPGMPGLLLAGAARLSGELEHRPDQLPLLQHALQATWHTAMRRWSAPGRRATRFEIAREHLPGQAAGSDVPDLGACLKARADKAADRAEERFAEVAGSDRTAGKAALRAAFRALARRDDRGNWARRFASRADIVAFLAADSISALGRLPEDVRWDALRQGLHVFLLRGYLSGGGRRDYDISHEALIRNWPRFQEWLRDPEEVAYALGRVLAEVEPADFDERGDAEKMRLIPADVAARVRMVSGDGKLPERWGEDQIAPILLRPAMKKRWGEEKGPALREVVRLSIAADKARRDADTAAKAAALKALRARFRARAGSLVALAMILAASFVYVYRRDTKAKIVVAQNEAKASIATANEAVAKAKADAARELSRALGAHGLIGSMQSDAITAVWPTGIRERAALHTLNMLLHRGGKEPDPKEFRPLAFERWEAGARAMLGRRYRLTKLLAAPVGDGQPACITALPGALQKGPEPGLGPQASLDFVPGGDTARVRLSTNEPGRLSLSLQTGAQSGWREVEHNLVALAQPSSRICLGSSGSVLTFSPPGAPLPYIYELSWRRCTPAEPCKAGAAWQVNGQPIDPQPPLPPQTETLQGSFPCVRAIRTIGSPDDASMPAATEVDFSAEDGEAGCSGDGSENWFRAAYLPGTASLRPVRGGVGQAPTLNPCGDMEVAPDGTDKRTCEVERLPADVDPTQAAKVILRRNTKGARGNPDGVWSLEFIAPRQEVRFTMPIFAGTIVKAGLDGQDNLVLADEMGLHWMVLANRSLLKKALEARACYKTGAIPKEMEMLMTESDKENRPVPDIDDNCPNQ